MEPKAGGNPNVQYQFVNGGMHMPRYLDIQQNVESTTAQAAADAPMRDLQPRRLTRGSEILFHPPGDPLQEAAMSVEDNRTLVRRWLEEGYNQGNVTIIDELTAPDFVDHHLPPGVPPNAEGHKAWLQVARAGFPDLHITIEDMIAEGDKVVARSTVTRTQTGEFMGIPPSGKAIRVGAIGIIRIADGRFVEYWENFDALGLMQQVGAIPTPG